MVYHMGIAWLALGTLWRSAAWVPDDVPLTLLPKGTEARCLDGSPAGFFLDRATSPKSRTKWAMVLQGGAQCDEATLCQQTANSTLGSSAFFGKNLGWHERHFIFWLSGDEVENPKFASWNRVYLPYCSQDLWSGTRTEPSEETFGMYFSGHLIIQAVVQYLIAHEGMGWASDLILGGVSAGGIGSWLNAGYIFSRLPFLQRAVHAPIAGYYFPTTRYYGPGWHEPWKPEMNQWSLERSVQVWRSHMDEHCLANMAGKEFYCMLASYSASHAPWRIFVIQAQTDEMQLMVRDGIPGDCHDADQECEAFMENWRSQFMDSMRASLKATDGWFAPACFMHHRFFADRGPWIYDGTSHKSVNYLEALGTFYDGANVRLEDSCGLNCGTCGAAREEEVSSRRLGGTPIVV